MFRFYRISGMAVTISFIYSWKTFKFIESFISFYEIIFYKTNSINIIS